MSFILRVERGFGVDALFELLALLQRPAPLLIVPEIRGAGFCFECGELFACGSASKKAPHKLDAFIQLGVALLQVFDVFSHLVVTF